MNKLEELQNEIKQLKKRAEKDGAFIIIDTPKLDKKIEEIKKEQTEYFKKQEKNKEEFENQIAMNISALEEDIKNLLIKYNEQVEKALQRSEKGFTEKLEKAISSIGEFFGKTPKWYKEQNNDNIFKAIIDIMESKQTAERNDTIEEMESRLNDRDKKLWKRIKELVAKVAIGQQRQMGGGAPTVTKDLTSQCNGSTKTFTLPTKYRAGSLAIYGTQFPKVYRPVIDYTEDGGNKFTLTSEVGAPQTGQTLIARYDQIS